MFVARFSRFDHLNVRPPEKDVNTLLSVRLRDCESKRVSKSDMVECTL